MQFAQLTALITPWGALVLPVICGALIIACFRRIERASYWEGYYDGRDAAWKDYYGPRIDNTHPCHDTPRAAWTH